MEDKLQEKPGKSLADYWTVICHRRRLVVVAALLTWLLAVAASWMLPARYRSEALILAEQQRVPAQLVPPNVSIDPQEYVQSLSQQVFSRSRLLRIMDQYHLYEGIRDPDVRVDRMRHEVGLEAVKPTLRSPGDKPQMTAFTLSFSAGDPHLAQQVTEQLTSFLIEDSLQNQQQLSENTTGFLQDQLKQAAKDLADQEQQMKDFRTKSLGELPEQLQSNLQILSGLQTQLSAANDALNRAEQQKVYLTSLIEQYKAAGVRTGAASGGGSTAGSMTIDQQLDRLHEQLADAQARYTPNHPDVIRLQQQIAATEKLKQQQAKTGKPASSGATAAEVQAMTPMLQLESQLKATDMEIANRKREVAALEGQIGGYQGRLNQTPVREQELASVTRNYEQAKTNYQSLLAKAQQSGLATSLQRQQQGDQFRVLDPPTVPMRPYFPNRLIFCLAGLGAGLGVGLVLSLGLEALDPRIYREEDLQDAKTAPVLAAIPPLPTAAELRSHARFRRLEWATVSLILVTVSAVTLFTFLRG